MTYIINGEEFKTQKVLKEKIRSILYKYEDYYALSTEDSDFMMAVLKLHPDADKKIGCGIRDICVRTNKTYLNKEFCAIRIDETEVDFSFNECIKRTSQLTKFYSACRKIVAEDIIAFRNVHWTSEAICPILGISLCGEYAHVDHIPPKTFKFIVDSFCEKYKINPLKAGLIGDIDNVTGDIFEDKTIAPLFRDYHNSIAELRLVSKLANLSNIRKESNQPQPGL